MSPREEKWAREVIERASPDELRDALLNDPHGSLENAYRLAVVLDPDGPPKNPNIKERVDV